MAILEASNIIVSSNGTLPRVPFLALKDAILGKSYELSIAFVPPKKARAINIERRGKGYVPNTLAFELDKKSGEIIMCKSAIRSQYKDFDMNHETYMLFLVIHSMLHLKGYDHGGTMEKAEAKFLKRFAYSSK